MKSKELIKRALLNIDEDEFNFRNCDFFGEDGILIFPKHVGVKWNQKNKYLRSVIINEDNNVLSSGFPRFVNWSENPDNFPVPKFDNIEHITLKLDGSCVIVDAPSFEDEMSISIRTRGSHSCETLETCQEIRQLVLRGYPRIGDFIRFHPNLSLLFEYTTPTLKIVIDYPEPDLTLIGAVNKDDLTLVRQNQLDEIAKIMQVKRPKYYSFLYTQCY